MDTTFSVAERDDDGTVEGRERVILIGLDTSVTSGWDMEETMEELESLVDTAGGVVVGQVIQRRQKPDPAYFIGKGKAEEVELMREAFEAELIVFNDELGPAQQRNLESVINAKVIDRTQLILDIFAQRAETAEGKLQVELAQLQYLLPRLTGKGTVLSRLGGGIGTRGPGETKLEMDKRVIRGRIADIKEQIEDVRKRRGVQRSKRQEANIPVLSLVGYTNAGKSSLLNKVTGADVFVEDKLFATLDPVTRKIELPNQQEVLMTDTVGFIQKLPHHLVAAFRATLEEISESDVLLHVVDASHPKAEEHCEAVFEVLKDLNVNDKPIVTVLNKVDVEESAPMVTRLEHVYPVSVAVSTVTGEGIDKLLSTVQEILSQRRVTVEMLFAYGDPMISLIHSNGKVLNESYVESGVIIKAELDKAVAGKVRKSASAKVIKGEEGLEELLK